MGESSKTIPLNCVITANKPTVVSHSCAGNFTSAEDYNLIIGKCTRIEIHLVTPKGGLELKLDVPIYGRIAALEIFRPRGKKQDFLFLATKRFEICILQWDSKKDRLKSSMVDFPDIKRIGFFQIRRQIALVEPDCRLIGLLCDELFKVIPLSKKGELMEAFDIRFDDLYQILAMSFLDGCSEPTVAILYKEKNKAHHIATRKLSIRSKKATNGPWSLDIVDVPSLLIPVPRPLCGILIIGREITYCSASAVKTIAPISREMRAYGRASDDGSVYLLGDNAGYLHRLVITTETETVRLKVDILGKTSIASTISCLNNELIYVGAICGDSQLLRLIKSQSLEVLERYENLGGIADFCVMNVENQRQKQMITHSANIEDHSLHIIRNVIGINKEASIELDEGIQVIDGMWSLRSSTDDSFDTFLVISYINSTVILALNDQNVLVERDVAGFCPKVRTLLCQNANYNQLIQVTESSVRLIKSSSGNLLHKWHPPADDSIAFATASANQVLLATKGCLLVYLEIRQEKLEEAGHQLLKYDVTCLNMNPIGANPNYSELAAVGSGRGGGVRIYSLPSLQLCCQESLPETSLLLSVLICALDGIPYLLCAVGDGHLFQFSLEKHTGVLSESKMVPLETVHLCTFSFKNATRVFAASDEPTIIYGSKGKFLYNNINLKNVRNMCRFSDADFPDRFAFAKDDELIIGFIDDFQKLEIRSMPLGEHVCCISHQEQTGTVAACGSSSISLLDDQSLQIISTYRFDQHENGCSIISCSFSGYGDVYYCAGTSYNVEDRVMGGRIRIFIVKDRQLQLISDDKIEKGICSLSGFNGKLLVGSEGRIRLYDWVRGTNGAQKLQLVCGRNCVAYPESIRTHRDLILFGNESLTNLFVHKEEQRKFVEIEDHYLCCFPVEILDDETHLRCSFEDLYTMRRNVKGRKRPRKPLELLSAESDFVGKYHLGEHINQFHQGSLLMRPSDSQIRTVIFGTSDGVIGVIATLTRNLYNFFEKLQGELRKEAEGVGGLLHKRWRSVRRLRNMDEAIKFIDGDFIESVLHLEESQMKRISKAMNCTVNSLRTRVQILVGLHRQKVFV